MAHLKRCCLLCFEELAPSYGWLSFFIKEEEALLCRGCEQKFERLEGELCGCCGRSLERLAAEHQDKGICRDCLRWEEGPLRGALLRNYSLYVYNDWAKEVLSRYKFRGDAVLAAMFHKELRRMYRQIPSSCLIFPVPLSRERQYERGFNQAELLAACLPNVMEPPIVRTHTEKQSKKTRLERLRGRSPFSFSSPDRFDGKDILLIDDVYTTGTTLRQIGQLFRERGALAVYTLTIFRG